jgi:hypothetical protein
MYNICADKSLWTKVDIVSDGHTPAYARVSSCIHENTVSLTFRKEVVNDERENEIDTCFGTEFFPRLDALTKLKKLVVTNHNLSREIVR